MDQPLIAEDLLLLLTDDQKGVVSSSSVTPALGGALLVELALAGAVEVEAKTSVWRSATVHPLSVPLEHPELVTAWTIVAKRERTARTLVDRLGKGARERLNEQLAARGILERRETKVLGLFHRTVWPEIDSAHETAVRQALTSTLVQGTTPDDRTRALVALLSAIGWADKVVDHDGLPAREVKRRAKEIADGDWAATAVKDALAAAGAAVTAAAVIVATSSSGS